MKNWIIAILVLAVLTLAGYAYWWYNQAVTVAGEEFGPKAALTKYQWFIDQSNYIKKADADVALYQQRLTDVETFYVDTYGSDKTKWSASTQLQYNDAYKKAHDDLLAIVSNRNGLVKDYNSQSEKFNWAPFLTRTDLPPQSYTETIIP